jgi:cAMP-dependent protein kinase regulator
VDRRAEKEKAAQCLSRGRIQEAIDIFEALVQDDPSETGLYIKVAEIYQQFDQIPKATHAYYLAARQYDADGFLLKAIAMCRLILSLDAEDQRAKNLVHELNVKRVERRQTEDLSEALPSERPAPVKFERPETPLFSSLPESAFEFLSLAMKLRTFSPGQLIIREGDLDDSFFVLASGRVRIFRERPDGKQIEVAELEEDHFFGEAAFLSGGPRTASVSALEEARVFELERSVLATLVERHPEVRHVLERFYRVRMLESAQVTLPLFTAFSEEDRKSLADRFELLSVAPEEVVVRAGDDASGLYVILDGLVSVLRQDDLAVVAQLSRGDVFGERSLLERAPISCSVRAERPTLLLRLDKTEFDEVMMTHPQFLECVAEIASNRSWARGQPQNGHADA